jgi:hypothetical protein
METANCNQQRNALMNQMTDTVLWYTDVQIASHNNNISAAEKNGSSS